MSVMMEEEIKRWTARRKSALVLVLEIIQGKTTVAEASRQFDLTPSEIESWVEGVCGAHGVVDEGLDPRRTTCPSDDSIARCGVAQQQHRRSPTLGRASAINRQAITRRGNLVPEQRSKPPAVDRH